MKHSKIILFALIIAFSVILTGCGTSITSAEDFVYYTGEYLYKVNNVDGEKTKIPGSGNYAIKNPQVSDGWIYYNDSNKFLCRIKTDGTQTAELTNTAADNFQLSGGKIYFVNTADSVNTIYKMNPDGTQREKVAEA